MTDPKEEQRGSYQYEPPKRSTDCTLTDEQLVKAVEDAVCTVSASHGAAWLMSFPANFNRDHDMLVLELAKRFKRLTSV